MKKKQKRQRMLLEQQISQLRELELHQNDDVSCVQLTALVVDFSFLDNDEYVCHLT